MRPVSSLVPLALALLALAGCGHSDKANAPAAADNVEIPAEETMSGLDASAQPSPDPAATASDEATSAADATTEVASGNGAPPPPAPPVPAPPVPAPPVPTPSATPVKM